MARVYLDANFLIDTAKKRRPFNIASLKSHDLYISPLSLHILIYIAKYKIPDPELNRLKEYFYLVDFNEELVNKALLGPTNDFEDNVQLHSAAEAECDLFLTNDAKLLNLRFFGKTKIAPNF